MRRMPSPIVPLACAVIVAVAALAGSAVAQQAPAKQTPAKPDEQITIYRCVDAQGRLSLRDSPCKPGERQQVRQMIRPKDAPPRPVAAEPVRAPTTILPPPQVYVVNAPRPLYECVTPDNDTRYLSDSPEGNPRWVPAWAVGAPVFAELPVYRPGGGYVRIDNGRLSAGYHSGETGTAIVPTPAAYGVGTWVRDACYALPPIDACSHLRDERSTLGRRFFNAQPSERARIDREQRSIAARIAQDCS